MSGTRSDDREGPAKSGARRQLATSSAVAASLVCGLLIWAKLRLVTDIPRTAYANPERQVEDASDQGGLATREQGAEDGAIGVTAGVHGD